MATHKLQASIFRKILPVDTILIRTYIHPYNHKNHKNNTPLLFLHFNTERCSIIKGVVLIAIF